MVLLPPSPRLAGAALASVAAGAALSLAGCKTPGAAVGAGTASAPATAAVDPASRYKVTASSASFYKLGPQQPGGPDLGLKQGARLTLTRRGFGFSQVLLEDGTAGFVGTEDIARLTPEEIAAEAKPPVPAANAPGGAKPKPGAARRRARPGPSLPIGSGDEPGLPAAPDPTPRPGPVPTFRY